MMSTFTFTFSHLADTFIQSDLLKTKPSEFSPPRIRMFENNSFLSHMEFREISEK